MGLPILEGYGLTETAPVISANPPEEPRVGTMGPPLSDVETRIDASVVSLDGDGADGEGREGDGEVGELLVRGPNVAEEYWEKPDETRESFTTDGWFRTGDVVEVDADGYLTFRERRKQILVLSTGKNLAPGPIEDAFATKDLVEQCMVLGDGRKFVSALIVPNVGAVRDWAEEAGIDLSADEAGICADERIHDRIAAVVAEVNEGFEPHERIKQFRLVPEEFSTENDLLTPTLKKRRGTIQKRHEALIEEIYEET
jgi:long-chain acyl-CoA synthetase